MSEGGSLFVCHENEANALADSVGMLNQQESSCLAVFFGSFATWIAFDAARCECTEGLIAFANNDAFMLCCSLLPVCNFWQAGASSALSCHMQEQLFQTHERVAGHIPLSQTSFSLFLVLIPL
jgi:hypothetical protein